VASARIPDGLPFAVEEYRDRATRVRAAMSARGVDVLYVTSPPNILYLTGYEAIWYPWRLPVGVALHRSSPELVFFDWTRHAGYVRRSALHDDAVFFEYGATRAPIASALAGRGWTEGTVGVERFSLTPAAPIVDDVAAGLRAAGAEVIDGDWIVDGVRLLKSPAEVERIRRAATMADEALLALQREIRPGLTQLEISSLASLLLARAGSEIAASQPLVSSGPHAWADTHAFPSSVRIADDDTVSIDVCAVVDRYHVNLSRTYSVGRPNALATTMLEQADASLAVLKASARLGDDPAIACAAAEAHIREQIAGERIWWIGGYSLGLSFPPSWVGHTYHANDGLDRWSWAPGYLSNFENVLHDEEQGFAAITIDSVLMTDAGLESLSSIPRTLLPAG